MRKMRTTIGVVIDTLGSIIIYAVIAAAILFMAGQAKHYYDVGYGVFSQQGKDTQLMRWRGSRRKDPACEPRHLPLHACLPSGRYHG